jgi:transposase
LRKKFNGLYGLVRDDLGCDPESGHVFLFANARRNRLKLLVYDGSGLWVCAKKLDGGRFRWPERDSAAKKIVLSHEELALLFGGIDLTQTPVTEVVSQGSGGRTSRVTENRINTGHFARKASSLAHRKTNYRSFGLEEGLGLAATPCGVIWRTGPRVALTC